MKASADSKKSRRPSAGNSSSISSSLWRRSMPSLPSSRFLGEPSADLVEDQANERFRPRNVRKVAPPDKATPDARTRSGRRCASRSAGDFGHRGVAVEAQNDMAVLNTPERSLSDLLGTSRAAEATTGCGPPLPGSGCCVVIIRCKVSSNGLAGSETSWRRRAASCPSPA